MSQTTQTTQTTQTRRTTQIIQMILKIFKNKNKSENIILKEIKKNKYKKIVVICGGEISNHCGIPNILNPNLNILNKLQKIDLYHLNEIFKVKYFNDNPKPFYDLIRELFPKTIYTSETHKFLNILNEKGILQKIYTQNIDGLEYKAGINEDKIICINGSLNNSFCKKCNIVYSMDWLFDKIFNVNENCGIPLCEKCSSVIRPGILFFDEKFPENFWDTVKKDLSECDLLLIIGVCITSSCKKIIDCCKDDTKRVFVSKHDPKNVSFFKNIGIKEYNFDRSNDVVINADCEKTFKNFI